MKKFKFTLFSLLVIIFSGLLIQRFSGYFYTTPVGIVKSVKIIDSEQLLTVKLVNNTKKTVVVKVKFNGNERVKSRLLCKMLYNVFTISTYQN